MLPDYEKLGVFYLGQTATDGAAPHPYLYESRHLTTHGVVIGMTGSGKTGLSIALLEEAAIDQVPAIVVDPKGDLTNLLLTFPELRPEDFLPWIAEGKDPAEEAKKWAAGLAAGDQDGARIQRLKDAADVRVYTPGSRLGVPISLVKSLAPPPKGADAEAVREQALGVVGSLLGLLGIEADPVKSREHLLLVTIVTQAWAREETLDIELLIARIQDPKIKKIGVLDLEGFYPRKERYELAVAFNHLLASPGFDAWLAGDPLDIDLFLRAPDGRPRISILSIAHLGDAERMVFVTLLLHQMIAWMRRQTGTSSLRALFFMDEIFGYFPPVANPPSKAPLLLLLKQARAFGLGILLATQNPVDLDYKGLANCGTWFVGRLQTERDKARVVEGLEGALAQAGIDRGTIERMLSSLAPRAFLVHDVHDPSGPHLVQTRFTLSYLRGPLSREELSRIVVERKMLPATETKAMARVAGAAKDPPPSPEGISTLYAPSAPGALLEAHALAVATVRFSDPKSKLDVVRDVRFAAPISDAAVPVAWGDARWVPEALDELAEVPVQNARFGELPSSAAKAKAFAQWQKDFVTWALANQGVTRFRDPATGLYSEVGEAEATFRNRLVFAGREQRDVAIDQLRAKYKPKFDKLAEKIEKVDAALRREEAEAEAARNDGLLQAGAGFLSAVLGNRKAVGFVRGAATAAKGVSRAKKQGEDVVAKREERAALTAKWQELDQEFRAAAAALSEVAPVPLEEQLIRPKKTGVSVALLGLLWRERR